MTNIDYLGKFNIKNRELELKRLEIEKRGLELRLAYFCETLESIKQIHSLRKLREQYKKICNNYYPLTEEPDNFEIE